MNQKTQNITIVGAGHYGKNLIAPVYASLPEARLRAIISKHATPETLRKTPLSGLPLFRNFKEWSRRFGAPTREDVFDLCVHHHLLPALLKKLAEIKGTHCILPKPVAVTQKNWEAIGKTDKENRLQCAVASQWYYSRLTRAFAAAYKKLSEKAPIHRITMDFSQEFTAEQLTHYSPGSGFLPHMLQILSSIGIPITTLGDCTTAKKKLQYEITYTNPIPISLVTDMGPQRDNPQKIRTVRVFTGGDMPAIESDFYAHFDKGKVVAYPSLTVFGRRREIRENNLRTMIKKILSAFEEKAVPFAHNSEVLSLEKYWPIARELIAIQSQLI